ncbi:hypothetical protein C8J57DRAFT_1306386 [Mycena rebaudengoi]|nr:hypothetical protein C8J57DRAFT_1306386 [Mycena rebaudengoi]
MAHSNLPAIEDIPGGSISKLKKDPLLAILTELRVPLPDKNTVPELRKLLNVALADPAAAMDERFQKFLVYRAATSHKKTDARTSADKSNEDCADAAAKGDAGASGANKTLLDQKVKTDPPPQHKRLGGTAPKKLDDDEASTLSDSDHSSEDLTPATPKDVPEVIDADTAVRKIAIDAAAMPLMVNFKGPDHREVWIPPAQRSQVPVFEAADNSGVYTTSLKTLLPMAIAQETPIKNNRKGKIGIQGITGGHLDLGTVDQLLSDTPLPVLGLAAADTFKLRTTDVALICDVFWAPAEQDTKLSALDPEMKPLDEARARAAVAAAAGPSSDGADPAFIAFLRQHLVTGDIKAQEWPQLSTISQMKVRWQYLAKAIQFLEGWKKPRGGYRVPTTYTAYAGRSFKKDDIERALHIGHSIAHKDNMLFQEKTVQHDLEAKRWVEEGKHADKFDKLTISQWQHYLREAKTAKEEGDKRRAKEEQRKLRHREKRTTTRAPSTSDSEEAERKRKRKAKGRRSPSAGSESSLADEDVPAKKKGKARARSSDLDAV